MRSAALKYNESVFKKNNFCAFNGAERSQLTWSLFLYFQAQLPFANNGAITSQFAGHKDVFFGRKLQTVENAEYKSVRTFGVIHCEQSTTKPQLIPKG